MLPDCRSNEYLYTVPHFNIEEDNVENFVDELQKFHMEFTDCFVRSEPRKYFFDYLYGRTIKSS